MGTKKDIFKKLLNNSKYTGQILQAINNHDFKDGVLKLDIEEHVIELIQVGNDIKVKE